MTLQTPLEDLLPLLPRAGRTGQDRIGLRYNPCSSSTISTDIRWTLVCDAAYQSCASLPGRPPLPALLLVGFPCHLCTKIGASAASLRAINLYTSGGDCH